MDIFQEVRKIISENLDIPESEITLNAHLEKIGVDSLEVRDLIMTLRIKGSDLMLSINEALRFIPP